MTLCNVNNNNIRMTLCNVNNNNIRMIKIVTVIEVNRVVIATRIMRIIIGGSLLLLRLLR